MLGTISSRLQECDNEETTCSICHGVFLIMVRLEEAKKLRRVASQEKTPEYLEWVKDCGGGGFTPWGLTHQMVEVEERLGCKILDPKVR